jgi:hypothetical protein
MWYLQNIIIVDIFFLKFGQTLVSLTFQKIILIKMEVVLHIIILIILYRCKTLRYVHIFYTIVMCVVANIFPLLFQ